MPQEAEQARLVDAEIPDPVDVYKAIAAVKNPNQAQRAAIRQHVTGYPDLWREACDYFVRNGFNVRKIDNVIDRYQKAVAEVQRAEAARAREAEERRQREMPRLTPEEREANRRYLAEARAKLAARTAAQGLFAAAEGPRRPPWRPGQP